MTICEYCTSNFFKEPYWKPKEKKHHSNIVTWEESSKHCTICACLLDAVKDAVARSKPLLPADALAVLDMVLPVYSVELQESIAREQFVLIFRPVKEKVEQINRVTHLGSPDRLVLAEKRFQVYATRYDEENPYDEKIPEVPQLSTETSIDYKENPNNRRTLDQIQRWLKGCDLEHELCKCVSGTRSTYKRFVPTRLIDVGNDGENHVRLVDTSEEKNDYYQYATLSHCWGGSIAVTTFADNIEEFKKSISLDGDFPRNFREAISLCRALKIRYIWIDTLCIIQDRKTDWHHEAPLMHEVYGNSYLNIAATSARNSTEGLFRHRQIDLLPPSTVLCGWQTRQRHCRVIREDFWESELLAEPLYKRAWVSQERMLAPRTLNFGTKQLFWQCLSLNACETMPNGVPAVVNSGGQQELQWRQLRARTKRQGLFSAKDRIQLQDVWRDAVKNYSSCNITKTSDKLPALAGMAQVMHSICKENYVAGMWGDGQELVVQLAWKVKDCRNAEGRSSRRQRADEYRAPTWAWPSVVDGVIEIPRRIGLHRDYELTLNEKPRLQYEVQEETFLELKSGSIDATGIVLNLEFTNTNDPDTPCWIWNSVLSNDERPWCYLYPDEPLKVPNSDATQTCTSQPPSTSPAVRRNSMTVSVLLLFHSKELNGYYSGRGLAIHHLPASHPLQIAKQRTTFCRIGLVEFRFLEEATFDELLLNTVTDSRVEDGKMDVVLV